jgi:hypothetical protein
MSTVRHRPLSYRFGQERLGHGSEVVEADGPLDGHPVGWSEFDFGVEAADGAGYELSATTTLRSRGNASSRMRTTTGRRPSCSSSSQATSPRATKAVRGSPRARSCVPRPGPLLEQEELSTGSPALTFGVEDEPWGQPDDQRIAGWTRNKREYIRINN